MSFAQIGRHDLALDMGSSVTSLFTSGAKVIFREPSYVAIERGKKELAVAVGKKARDLLGRTSDRLVCLPAYGDGAIEDPVLAVHLVRDLASRANAGLARAIKTKLFGSRAVVALPERATELERRALMEVVHSTTAREAFFIPSLVAAALGCEVSPEDTRGTMVLSVGCSRSSAAVLSAGTIVSSGVSKVGGRLWDTKIIEGVRRVHGVLIGEHTAEQVKRELGRARPTSREATLQVYGRSIHTGLPSYVTINQRNVTEWLAESSEGLIQLIEDVLAATPPELAADVLDTGIIMCGGGAYLRDLDRLILERTGLPLSVVEEPEYATIRGEKLVLEEWDRHRHLLQRV